MAAYGVVASLAAAGALGVSRLDVLPAPLQLERCTVSDGTNQAVVSLEESANAAMIAAVGLRKKASERDVTIALATAIQESGLRNLPGGDRDSIGLFQQRPSQGWGSAAQVRDPVYAAGRFYDALAEVDGADDMSVTEAAQEVQRSAHPDAYADHEDEAAVLAAALTGASGADLSCSIRPAAAAAESPGADGLTPRADRVREDLRRAFGRQRLGGFAPGGVTSGHIEGSAHYDGRAIDVFFRPPTATKKRSGWATAHYLVARAKVLGIATVIYDGRIWTARRSQDGWRDYRPPGGDASNDVLMHRDHVHVDVIRGAAR